MLVTGKLLRNMYGESCSDCAIRMPTWPEDCAIRIPTWPEDCAIATGIIMLRSGVLGGTLMRFVQ